MTALRLLALINSARLSPDHHIPHIPDIHWILKTSIEILHAAHDQALTWRRQLDPQHQAAIIIPSKEDINHTHHRVSQLINNNTTP